MCSSHLEQCKNDVVRLRMFVLVSIGIVTYFEFVKKGC
uniref:Uncharacterized protein n=1 Tax=Arundo donax TaxID=35708 RepID=A0A0A8ZF13_ARUDO